MQFFILSYNLFFAACSKRILNPFPSKSIKDFSFSNLLFVLNMLKIIKAYLWTDGSFIKFMKSSDNLESISPF